MMSIDGSYGEAGGQILRTSIALSAVTQEPCKIVNIRKGRPQPGLKAQHLEAVKAVAALCGAEVSGLELGSTEITFMPGKIKSGEIEVRIPTAGSIGLVLQAMMVPAIHAEGAVAINFYGGATNGKWAPPLNYIKYVLLPLLKGMGYKAEIEAKRYGYFPKGGAEVTATLSPSQLKPLRLTERGQLVEIRGISHASSFLENKRVAERQAEAAAKTLKSAGMQPEITALYSDAACPGSAVELQAIYGNTVLGADSLGERNVGAEDVGKIAARKLLAEINSQACVDEYAEDQLLPYMALAGSGEIRVPKLTGHTRTNIWAIEKFLPVKFIADEKAKVVSVAAI